MSERLFRIMGGPAVPWTFMSRHEAQAKYNHDQDLETLHRRGGLDPHEALLAAKGLRLFGGDAESDRIRTLSQQQANAELQALVDADLSVKVERLERHVLAIMAERSFVEPGSVLEMLRGLPCDCAHPGDGDPSSGLAREYARREAAGTLQCDRCRAIAVLERKDPEVCLCAALQFADGYVIRGHRHDDCIQTALKLGRQPGAAQGFLTCRGRFVDRHEGMRLQLEAGIASRDGYRGTTLFSEDLY